MSFFTLHFPNLRASAFTDIVSPAFTETTEEKAYRPGIMKQYEKETKSLTKRNHSFWCPSGVFRSLSYHFKRTQSETPMFQ